MLPSRGAACRALQEKRLTLIGGRRWLAGGLGFALAEETAVAEFPENVEEEDARDAEHDEALEKTVHGGEGARDENPPDPREWDEAEQDGNQEHHGKQWTSSDRVFDGLRNVISCQCSVLRKKRRKIIQQSHFLIATLVAN